MYSLKIMQFKLAEGGHHYTDELGRQFDLGPDGFVGIDGIATVLMDQQSQYAIRYLDGAIEGYPNLGRDIEFYGDFRNYDSFGIHPKDVSTFVRRYWAYQAHATREVIDNKGKRYILNEADREVLYNYLVAEGVSEESLIR
ncbi:hypothetical protein HYW35_03430 [Candidatus Saccharibacteria bacterium]|nr:hypothetical protein [Candidatus Saccharibacteria bacterium]